METQKKSILGIDLKQNNMLPMPQFIQHDTNIIEFDVKNAGETADLSNIGRIVANYKRPDKKVITRLLEAEGSTISYTIGLEEMAVAGMAELELQFFSQDNQQRISTKRFKVHITQQIGSSEVTPGDNNLTLLQELFVEVDQKVSIADEATDFAIEKGNYAKEQGDYIEEKKPDIEKFTGEQTNLQAQLNQLVIDGDSSPEAAQARVDGDGNSYTTLQERLNAKDAHFSEVLAEIETQVLEGVSNTERLLTTTDLIVGRGTFTVNADGDLLITEDTTTSYTHALVQEGILDMQYVVTAITPYLIVGNQNGVIHMIMLIGASAGKVYPVTSNGTTLGGLITTIPIAAAVANDVIRVQRSSDRLVFTKNGVAWFEITNTAYPSIIKNQFGFLTTTKTRVNAEYFSVVKVLSEVVSGVLQESIKALRNDLDTAMETISVQNDYYNSVKWGTVGDSITANDGGTYGTNYRTLVQRLLGVSAVNNVSVTGSMIAGKTGYTKDSSAMYLRYAALDNDCDIITVFGGTNDYREAGGDGVPIGVKGSNDPYNFYGALKTLIEGLHTKFPTGKILFITPLRRTNDTTANLQGHKLIDYVNAIKDICADYSIPVLDLYNQSGINSLNSATLLTDGLHPNGTGYEIIARKIAKYIDRN